MPSARTVTKSRDDILRNHFRTQLRTLVSGIEGDMRSGTMLGKELALKRMAEIVPLANDVVLHDALYVAQLLSRAVQCYEQYVLPEGRKTDSTHRSLVTAQKRASDIHEAQVETECVLKNGHLASSGDRNEVLARSLFNYLLAKLPLHSSRLKPEMIERFPAEQVLAAWTRRHNLYSPEFRAHFEEKLWKNPASAIDLLPEGVLVTASKDSNGALVINPNSIDPESLAKVLKYQFLPPITSKDKFPDEDQIVELSFHPNVGKWIPTLIGSLDPVMGLSSILDGHRVTAVSTSLTPEDIASGSTSSRSIVMRASEHGLCTYSRTKAGEERAFEKKEIAGELVRIWPDKEGIAGQYAVGEGIARYAFD